MVLWDVVSGRTTPRVTAPLRTPFRFCGPVPAGPTLRSTVHIVLVDGSIPSENNVYPRAIAPVRVCLGGPDAFIPCEAALHGRTDRVAGPNC